MPPDQKTSQMQRGGLLDALPEAWRMPILSITAAVVVLILVTAREWGEMLHQWWNIDTYSHILLVPLIIAWLVALKIDDLATISPRSFAPGLGLLLLALGLWLGGRATGINLLAHAGAVGAIQATVLTILGLRAAVLLFLPLCFAAFLVPFGDEIIGPLQMITAEISIWLTELSGIDASIDGIYIDTPVGLFVVAEACSGVRFLIAMVTLAVLVCFTRFESWSKRALFLAASAIVPILANGVRAWGTIYIAQIYGIEFAEGFDHVVYGWFFFAFVVVVLLAAAWRFFEREPDDYGWTAEEIAHSLPVRRFESVEFGAGVALVAVISSAVLASVMAAVLASSTIG
ncbi:exosortase A [Erythrobacter sp. YT30]|uniref:exosortase A n=1 Tax=Erythrobacter sp. YT30 TaxID=1735012 RepID=UPI00076C265B|nr:exosortase A [Erythrobacter sp. YT30]KWV93476.1 exosortase [Erythrobacter sp. YT30]